MEEAVARLVLSKPFELRPRASARCSQETGNSDPIERRKHIGQYDITELNRQIADTVEQLSDIAEAAYHNQLWDIAEAACRLADKPLAEAATNPCLI